MLWKSNVRFLQHIGRLATAPQHLPGRSESSTWIGSGVQAPRLMPRGLPALQTITFVCIWVLQWRVAMTCICATGFLLYAFACCNDSTLATFGGMSHQSQPSLMLWSLLPDGWLATQQNSALKCQKQVLLCCYVVTVCDFKLKCTLGLQARHDWTENFYYWYSTNWSRAST